MRHQGSCHCGEIAFEFDADVQEAMDCNCSMCRRRGGLLVFLPSEDFRLTTPRDHLSTYTFNTHALNHHFCATCGIAPFSEGEKAGKPMTAINLRCVPDIDLDGLSIRKWDGKSR